MTRSGARRPYPERVPDQAEEIVEHLFALVDRLRGELERAVAEFDLSVAQAKALRYLTGAGPVPMRELAERLRCDASNVTGLVDRLEQRGLVERRAAPADRRVRTLVVTPAGAKVARTMWTHVVTGAVPMVGLAEDEQATLLVLLRRLDHGPSAPCWVATRTARQP
ncbi:MAG: MarR family transcriptional regulator [Acidimicrobiales bacterium]